MPGQSNGLKKISKDLSSAKKLLRTFPTVCDMATSLPQQPTEGQRQTIELMSFITWIDERVTSINRLYSSNPRQKEMPRN
jgi:hypothetical protein